MASVPRLQMEKLNGTNFKLWKLKMEDFPVDQDLCIVVFGIKPSSMKDEAWVVLEIKAGHLIRFCLVGLVLLNVFGEYTIASLQKKLRKLHYAKSLVHQLFLQRESFALRLEVDDLNVVKHLNAFNTIVT